MRSISIFSAAWFLLLPHCSESEESHTSDEPESTASSKPSAKESTPPDSGQSNVSSIEDSLFEDSENGIELRSRTRTRVAIGLILRSSPPGATVLINGEGVGITPMFWETDRSGEAHHFSFSKEGFNQADYAFVVTRSGIVHPTLARQGPNQSAPQSSHGPTTIKTLPSTQEKESSAEMTPTDMASPDDSQPLQEATQSESTDDAASESHTLSPPGGALPEENPPSTSAAP